MFRARNHSILLSAATHHHPTALYDNLGRFHNYLRISLTERCNLRCLYCMPETGLPELTEKSKLLTTDEILRISRLFISLGVDKVRLTGGEPLLHPDAVPICRAIRDAGVNTIGITTNAILLHRHLTALKEAGLTNINVSLDTLQEDVFMLITRRKGFNRVMDCIRLAENMNFKAVKINCVVMRGINDKEVAEFAMMTKDRNIEIRFIEYMPFDDNKWERNKMVSFMEMMDLVEAEVEKFMPQQQLPTAESEEGKSTEKKKPKKRFLLEPIAPKCGDTAKVFTLPASLHPKGRVGFITSMTTQFCGTCNRLRLTADGHLKVCLFDSNEVSLRDPMRAGASDEELTKIIEAAIKQKHPSLGGKSSPEEIASSSNRHMSSIGG